MPVSACSAPSPSRAAAGSARSSAARDRGLGEALGRLAAHGRHEAAAAADQHGPGCGDARVERVRLQPAPSCRRRSLRSAPSCARPSSSRRRPGCGPGSAPERPARAAARASACRPQRSRGRPSRGLPAPARSSAFTSACEASHGAISAGDPVRMLTTPPGTSLVASTSPRLIALSGRVWSATTTTVLPATSAGAMTATSPSRLEPAATLRRDDRDDAGRLGHRDVEVRARDRVARSDRPGRTCRPSRRTRSRCRSPRRPGAARPRPRRPRTRRSPPRTGRDGRRAARRCGRAPGRGCRPWRPPSRTAPPRAATTASRASLRLACAAFARNAPFADSTS